MASQNRNWFSNATGHSQASRAENVDKRSWALLERRIP